MHKGAICRALQTLERACAEVAVGPPVVVRMVALCRAVAQRASGLALQKEEWEENIVSADGDGQRLCVGHKLAALEALCVSDLLQALLVEEQCELDHGRGIGHAATVLLKLLSGQDHQLLNGAAGGGAGSCVAGGSDAGASCYASALGSGVGATTSAVNCSAVTGDRNVASDG